MIAQDTISQGLTAIAVFIVLYLSTFETTTVVLFPAFLLIAGVVMQIFFMRRIEVVDHVFEEETAQNIGFYTLLALAGMAVGSFVSPALAEAMPTQKMQMTGTDAMLYALLMAIAEEQFFRGAITNFMLILVPAPMAIMGSAGIFTVYHFAMYGTDLSALAYVFIGGVMLAWAAYRSGRLSPSTLAHVINNLIASVM